MSIYQETRDKLDRLLIEFDFNNKILLPCDSPPISYYSYLVC